MFRVANQTVVISMVNSSKEKSILYPLVSETAEQYEGKSEEKVKATKPSTLRWETSTQQKFAT